MNDLEIKMGKDLFYIGDSEEKPKAFLRFVRTGETMLIADHTEVGDELKGQQVGTLLVEAIVNYVRNSNMKLIPLCPFVNAQIKKREEWQNVVK